MVLWQSSTDTSRWTDNGVLEFTENKNSADIIVDDTVSYQTMDEKPWGGCFNERGWAAMRSLSDTERTEIIEALFGNDGLKFTAARLPIAASDYAVEPYSYNETDGDFEMDNFSIDRDYENLLPYIRKAVDIQSELQFFATPWSPPSWIKKNKSLIGGEIDFTPENMQAYARYFVKYIKAYRNEGINLRAVTIQNEPTMSTAYTSCLWTGEQINEFIRDYLYPAIKQENIDIDIWLGTFTDAQSSLVTPALNDEATRKIIGAAAFQWWSAPLAAAVYENYTDIKLIQSETKCGDGKNDWTYAEEQFDCFKEFLAAGVSQYFLWNMVLDEKGANTSGDWLQNAPITVNSKTSEVSYNPSYYLTKHFCYYIEPGAVRIKTTGGFADAIAFKNPDGTIALEVKNGSDEPVTLEISFNGKAIQATLASHSINTFRCCFNAYHR